MEAEECENLNAMRSISNAVGNVNMVLNAIRAGLRSIGSILTAKIVIKRGKREKAACVSEGFSQ